MADIKTILQWFTIFSVALAQLSYLPFLKDLVVYVWMSGVLLFAFMLVLVYIVADKEMYLYLTKATRSSLPDGAVARGNPVAVPLSFEAFVSASVTMSVVGVLAVLLCASYIIQLACDGMQACVSPMVALTLNTVKPKCWDGAEDFRGKIAPSVESEP
ncbi:hypothetical protein ABL78_0403 [Leptomonas seymouri]|uniref:Uncharacterized protein n=1 Tax=Leptomonas seymouri TaxID=5684 RepID=A0A0N1IAA9_LEPSE|nr:hypothetical protein ABL78_0403 [Leptomonas seymouri]|eukprot:KPI90473.1 hypothetical protein ABL78_0403 [Leptomonas seymouri]